MAATLPQPSRPSLNPPTVALPPLPLSRKSLPTPSDVSKPSRLPSSLHGSSKLALGALTRSTLSTAAPQPQHANSTSNVPTLRSTSIAATGDVSPIGRSLRKTISIAAFPQPPGGGSRITSFASQQSFGSLIPTISRRESIESLSASHPPSGSVLPNPLRVDTKRRQYEYALPSRIPSGSMIPSLKKADNNRGSNESINISRPRSGTLTQPLTKAERRQRATEPTISSRGRSKTLDSTSSKEASSKGSNESLRSAHSRIGSKIPTLKKAESNRGSKESINTSRPQSRGMVPTASQSRATGQTIASRSRSTTLESTSLKTQSSSESIRSIRLARSRSGTVVTAPKEPESQEQIDANHSTRPTTSGGMLPKSITATRRNEPKEWTNSTSTDTTVRISKLQLPRVTTSSPFSGGNAPTSLNDAGKSRSVPNGRFAQSSDGLLNLPSPPQSRGSSHGSHSTNATTFEDIDDGTQGKEESSTDHGDSEREDKSKGKGNVVVSVRVRPDVTGAGEGEWTVDGRRSMIAHRGREGGEYHYDNVFGTHDKNAKVYDASAKRLVRRVMEGYNGTVFAYGMTGTGKTFSMQGTATSPGVIPLAITDIFSYIRETPRREFLLRVSYLEIYNEKIHDLLLPSTTTTGVVGPGAPQQEEIKLREDSRRGVYADPLKEEVVQSPTQLLRVIARGDHARRTGSTKYNARSSRSHAVVQIVVESRERAAGSGMMEQSKRAAIQPGGVRVSTLSLIDLAGSERAAETKERRTEGSHINKSLLTLGTVIARLSRETDKRGDKDGKHLPYRDSKLTRLLQPALSGDSLVSILCTIQIGASGSVVTAYGQTAETLNTLKFAARAKNNIVSHAKKAEEALVGTADAASRALLEQYRMEIQSLRGQLEGQAKNQSDMEERRLEKESQQRHEEQMLEMHLARTALKERIEHLNRLVLSSRSTGVNSSRNFSSLSTRPRLSLATNEDFDAHSTRSSASHSTLPALGPSSQRRASSPTQITTPGQPSKEESPISSFGNGSEESDSVGIDGNGTASLSAQVQALRADVTEKNRYIATLEQRLLQARRTSISLSQKASSASAEDGSIGSLLVAKDDEIASLRAKLLEKDNAITALQVSTTL